MRPFAGALLALLAAGCARPAQLRATPYAITPPLGLPPVPVPADNPMTVEKVALGRQLFYDRRVATQPNSACADCHLPSHGYSGVVADAGFHRHTPTAWNRAYGHWEFWDGAAGESIEQLVGGVLRFVNLGDARPVGARLAKIPAYRDAFRAAFGRDPDTEAAVQAIACYCRTLLAGDSPYDRFAAGDPGAMDAGARRGRDLFFGKAGCAGCHAGPNFTDERFHDIGIGQEDPQRRFYPAGFRGKPEFPELGRFNWTHRIEDRGAFKTPTLRQLGSTGPYMHDGRFKTLAEVVDYYDRGGLGSLGQDPRVHPLGLGPEEKRDLVAFLEALDNRQPPPPPPTLPP